MPWIAGETPEILGSAVIGRLLFQPVASGYAAKIGANRRSSGTEARALH
jgi:hypothetical protein